MTQETLVSISEASHIMGVSEVALRQWTDEGKIKAFVTPGGHRRYSKWELKKFMSLHHKMLGVKDLVVKLEDTAPMHREIDAAFIVATSRYEVSEATQEHLASLGRRILNLIIKSVTEPSRREENLKEIQDVGRDFGETLATVGLPLTDSVQAFIRHRDPVVRVTTELMKKRESVDRRVMDTIPLVDHAMDAALLSLVAAHQQHKNTSRNKPKGRSAE